MESEVQQDSSQEAVKKRHYDVLLILGVLGAWFVVQAWVLPGMGVST
jgi:hypothetical protein